VADSRDLVTERNWERFRDGGGVLTYIIKVSRGSGVN